MAKKAYIGVDNKARKVRKGYIGVAGVARRIKKAYIGIGGVARPCFGSGEIEYYGRITSLSVARHNLAGASNDNYAMFAGGVDGSYSDFVDIYDKSLVHTNTYLSEARYAIAGATLMDGGSKKYAVFAGGTTFGGVSDDVDFFDNSATKIASQFGLSTARTNLAGAYIGVDGFGGVAFAGGSTNSSSNAYAVNTIDIFNKSLTKRSSGDGLPTARTQLAAASAGDTAIFAGGFSVSYSNEAYFIRRTGESSITTSTKSLSLGRYRLTGGSIGDYALFAGGYEYQNGQSSVVDAYNKSLTSIIASDLSVPRENPAVATMDGYIVFSGGTPLSDAVDIYDQSLTHIIGFNLEVARYKLAGASVGYYALFAGGTVNNGQATDVVEAFSI